MKISTSHKAVAGGLPLIVSGIVFWGLVLVGLIVIVVVSGDQQKELNKQLHFQTLQIATDIEHLIEEHPDEPILESNRQPIVAIVTRALTESGFFSAELSYEGQSIIIGKPAASADVVQRKIAVHGVGEDHRSELIELKVSVPNREEAISRLRNKLFLSIGVVVFVFGFILQKILQHVLSRPILDMVQVAQAFRDGHVEVRFNEARKDELGYMARFINEALDSVLEQRDRTERALQQLGESQSALQEQRDSLEISVQERTQELWAANRELEAYSYSIAHDLRQPLRAIDGFSQLLLEDYKDLLDQEGKSYLNRVRNAAQRMGELIDDILELSRITRSEIIYRDIDLAAEARTILNRLQEQHPDRTVRLSVAESAPAQGDPTLLRVTLDNLLGNAWKYSAQNPQAHIEFGVERRGTDPVYFVRDNGVGFNDQYSEKLFRPFERLHSDKRFEGTGIGLATVARAIQRMGGKVWAESKSGEGAAFYFTLGGTKRMSSRSGTVDSALER